MTSGMTTQKSDELVASRTDVGPPPGTFPDPVTLVRRPCCNLPRPLAVYGCQILSPRRSHARGLREVSEDGISSCSLLARHARAQPSAALASGGLCVDADRLALHEAELREHIYHPRKGVLMQLKIRLACACAW